jgi:membrane protease YdiL (CAAX protease family)
LGISLAEFYQLVMTFSPLQTYFTLAFVNGVFAFIILFSLRQSPPDQGVEAKVSKTASRLVWLPHCFVILGCVVLLLAANEFADEPKTIVSYTYSPTLTIVWIPVVEEIVFRLGFGSWLRRIWSGWMGMYCSALFFAWMHSQPTLERLSEGHLGLPLGPFVLGCFCEVIYKYSGRLGPAILFHGVCNATGWLFAAWDPRVLDWLAWLYI